MARELVKKEIDSKTYEFEQFGAKKSLQILVRLSKLIGKPISLLISSFEPGKKMMDSELKPEMLSLAIEALTSNLDSTEVISLLETLCATNTLCDGAKINFDSHYEGQLPHLFKVVGAALEVQYGNFFDVLGAFRGSAVPRTMTQVSPT